MTTPYAALRDIVELGFSVVNESSLPSPFIYVKDLVHRLINCRRLVEIGCMKVLPLM